MNNRCNNMVILAIVLVSLAACSSERQIMERDATTIVAGDTTHVGNTTTSRPDSAGNIDTSTNDSGVDVTLRPIDPQPIRIVVPVGFQLVNGRLERWLEDRENLRWLHLEIEKFEEDRRPRLSIALPGDHAALYRGQQPPAIAVETGTFDKQQADGLALLTEIAKTKRHGFGVLIPPTAREPESGLWTALPTATSLQVGGCQQHKKAGDPTNADLIVSWNIHVEHVDKLLAYLSTTTGALPDQAQFVHAVLPQQIETRFLLISGQMSYGNLTLQRSFAIEGWQYNGCFVDLYDHGIWNPFRQSPNALMVDDADNQFFVSIPHHRSFGALTETDDYSVAALKRRFMQLVLERNFQRIAGKKPKVWVFGILAKLSALSVAQDSEGTNRRQELLEFFKWLNDHFVDKTYVDQQSIARYATYSDVRGAFDKWTGSTTEKAFGYDIDYANYKPNDAIYPYGLLALTKALVGTHFQGFISGLAGQTRGVRFIRCESTTELSCKWKRVDSTLECRPTGDGNGCKRRELTVLWSQGGSETIDLTKAPLSFEAEKLQIVNGRTGESVSSPSRSVTVTHEPLIISDR